MHIYMYFYRLISDVSITNLTLNFTFAKHPKKYSVNNYIAR